MRFRILTIAYVFALLAGAMTLFGIAGILASAGISLFWFLVFRGAFANFLPWLLVAALVYLAGLALLPDPQSYRASLRNSCLNNLKQISLALDNYRLHHGTYPPAYIADSTGKPMHSWRVLILPYLEHQSLFDEYDFNEPWDGPNNRKLWNQMPEAYRCPARDQARRLGVPFERIPENAVSYFAIVGDETAWPGARGIAESEIKDGVSDTLMLLEYSGFKEPWTSPSDLTLNQAISCLEANEPKGHIHIHEGFFTVTFQQTHCMTAYADGHGRAIQGGLPPETARAIMTVAGGAAELQSAKPWHDIPLNQVTVIRYDRVYAALVFAILAVLPSFFLPRSRKKVAR